MKRLVSIILAVCLILSVAVSVAACNRPQEYNGIYVINILFLFSDEQFDYIFKVLSSDGEVDGETLEAFAKTITVESNGTERYLFGEGGLFQEIENALEGLGGETALSVFTEYLERYNSDHGMVGNEEGYLIPLQGESLYMQSFTDLARQIYFNSASPAASVGNSFIDGKLAYCVTVFGAHIIMIKSLA